MSKEAKKAMLEIDSADMSRIHDWEWNIKTGNQKKEHEMRDEMFTPENIAKFRKATGGVWVFSDTRTALDEIERLQSELAHEVNEKLTVSEVGNSMIVWLRAQLATRDALIERLVEAGDNVCGETRFNMHTPLDMMMKYRQLWQDLVAEYRASKKESVE